MSTTPTTTTARERGLRALCGGAVHLPGEEGYDAACASLTAGSPGVAGPAPAAVLYPADEAEVAEALLHLGRVGLRVVVQRTGHAPVPVDDLGEVALLRTSGLGGVVLDERTGGLRARAGALWSDVVARADEHGLPVDAPHDLDRGVVGGSVLRGPAGLPAARALSARAVLADGGVLEVPDRSHVVLAGLRAGLLPAAVVTELVLLPADRPLASLASLADPEPAALARAVRDDLDPRRLFVG